MKIKYSKQRLNYNFKLGLSLVILGAIMAIVFAIYKNIDVLELASAGIGLIGAGLFSLAIYFYEMKKQYLSINNGRLTRHSLIPRKINLNEIKQIKKFAGDYTLKTDKTELTIDTQIIEKNSLVTLNNELNKLKLA